MKIGITGGIGSGKTSVCEVFSSYGIPVFAADGEAKKLYSLPELIHWIKENISPVVVDQQNIVDKKKLAAIVFSNHKLLKLLEQKIHPLVSEKFDQWTQLQSGYPYLLYEAAILFETGRYRHLDKTILVTAPESIRIQRVKARDHITVTEIKKRMAKQWHDSRKLPLADYVIENIEWSKTLYQIEQIHHSILESLNNIDSKFWKSDL